MRKEISIKDEETVARPLTDCLAGISDPTVWFPLSKTLGFWPWGGGYAGMTGTPSTTVL